MTAKLCSTFNTSLRLFGYRYSAYSLRTKTNCHRAPNIFLHQQRFTSKFGVSYYSTAEPGDSPKSEAESLESDTSQTNDTTTAAQETAELNELKTENEKLLERMKEAEDKYIRAIAETENVRQRMRKQVEDAKQFGIQGFCKDLLSVADTLRLATENLPAEQLENNFIKNMHDGLKLTESQLLQVFNKHGVAILQPEGEKFDPNFHEAVFQQPIPDKEAGTIFIVTKPGYTLNERVLRPALVGVVKGP